MNADAGGSPPSRRKSVLFCPECRFESTLSDGWLVVSDGDERSVVCPKCGHVADNRSEWSAPAPQHAD